MSVNTLTPEEQVEEVKKECFVIMPISDPEGYSEGHFERVYKDIFIPAIVDAGFTPKRADEEIGTNLIHLEILRKLIECPLVICDLSSRNPNVLFELGIRQAFDKPVILVQEVGTPRIFDIASLRCVDYRKDRIYHEVLEDQQNIKGAIIKTEQEWADGTSVNSIIKLLSLTQPASTTDLSKSNIDPMMQIVLAELSQIKDEVRNTSRHSNAKRNGEDRLSFIRTDKGLDRISVWNVPTSGDIALSEDEDIETKANTIRKAIQCSKHGGQAS